MNHTFKTIVGIILALVSLAYPFIIYFGRTQFEFRYLLLGLAIIWLVRSVWQQQRAQQMMGGLVCAFLLGSWLLGSQAMLYWYPVLISGGMLAIFAASLFAKQTVIERLARLQQPDLPPQAVIYTRNLTKIWIGFFCVNIAITITLIYHNIMWWTWYTGLISYLLMGSLFAGEWLYRKFKLQV